MNKNTNLEQQYLQLMEDIVKYGVSKDDRTGTGTKSLFGRQLRHNMSDGFPLLTTKKMAWRSIVTELLWFLRGDTNIRYLKENNCNIWDGDCWKAYQKSISILNNRFNSDVVKKYGVENKEEFFERLAEDEDFNNVFGDFGPIYGQQYRNWLNECGDTGIDQVESLLYQIKTNPDSRRLLVNVWNCADIHKMVLPPCHYSYQIYTRELSNEEIAFEANKRGFNLKGMTISGKLLINPKEVKERNLPTRAISLMFNMRSSDVPLGLPFNLASYGLLLEIFGRMVNMVPDELIATLGDAHVYNNQVDGVYEQISRTPLTFPKLVMDTTLNFNGSLDDLLATATPKSFNIEGYESHPTIKYPLSN